MEYSAPLKVFIENCPLALCLEMRGVCRLARAVVDNRLRSVRESLPVYAERFGCSSYRMFTLWDIVYGNFQSPRMYATMAHDAEAFDLIVQLHHPYGRRIIPDTYVAYFISKGFWGALSVMSERCLIEDINMVMMFFLKEVAKAQDQQDEKRRLLSNLFRFVDMFTEKRTALENLIVALSMISGQGRYTDPPLPGDKYYAKFQIYFDIHEYYWMLHWPVLVRQYINNILLCTVFMSDIVQLFQERPLETLAIKKAMYKKLVSDRVAGRSARQLLEKHFPALRGRVY